MNKTTRLELGNVFTLPRHLEARLFARTEHGRVCLRMSESNATPAVDYHCKEWLVVRTQVPVKRPEYDTRCANSGHMVWAVCLDDFGEATDKSPILHFAQAPTWQNAGVVEPLTVLRTYKPGELLTMGLLTATAGL